MKLILIFILITNYLMAQTSPVGNSHYSKAIGALEAKDTTNAKEYLLLAMNEDNVPKAYLEYAKIKIRENTPNSRNHALSILKKASLKFGENLEVCLEYGKLLEDFALESSYDYYLDLLEVDNQNPIIHNRLGSIKAREFKEYYKSRQKTGIQNLGGSSDSTNSEGLYESETLDLFYDKFTAEDFSLAEKHLKRALEIDPNLKEAYFELFYLYEYSSKYDEALNLLKTKSKYFEDDPHYNLYLGLLYYKTNQYEDSYQCYKKALKQMIFNEKMEFNYHSVKNLISPLLEKDIEEYSYEEILDFIDYYWRVKEPLHLTDFNERVLEHYSRLAVANLHFKTNRNDKSGWETDRGEILLRYGEPKDRIRYRPWVDLNTVASKTDVWIYEYMTLGFSDQYWSGDFTYSAPYAGDGSQFAGNTHDIVENIFRTANEVYIPKYEGPTLDINMRNSLFRNLENAKECELYINYIFPVNDTNWLDGGEFITGFYQFDQEYNKKKSIVDSIKFNMNSKVYIDSAEYYAACTNVKFSPNYEICAFEILRLSDKGAVSNRFKIEETDNHLFISDPLFCFDVNEDKDAEHLIIRKNVGLTPNPLSIFHSDEDIFLYFEIYNLEKNESGLVEYEQNITISEIDSSGIKESLNSVLDFVGLSLSGETVSLSTNMKSFNINEQVYFQLDVSSIPSGTYNLEIEIKDVVAGVKTSKNVEFILK